jgi:hypothetical protein
MNNMKKVQQIWATIGKGLLAFPTLLSESVDYLHELGQEGCSQTQSTQERMI